MCMNMYVCVYTFVILDKETLSLKKKEEKKIVRNYCASVSSYMKVDW